MSIALSFPRTSADEPADEIDPPPPADSIDEIRLAVDIDEFSDAFALLPVAAQMLLVDRPGAQAAVLSGRVAAVYGTALAEGPSAIAAEEAFWRDYGTAFLDLPVERTMTRTHEAGIDGRFTVFAYNQHMSGIPVEYATARLLVVNDESNRVVHVGARFADPISISADDAMIAPDLAIASVAEMPSFSYFSYWTEPELVIYAGSPDEFGLLGFGSPVLAWKFSAEFESDSTPIQALTFFVDARTAEFIAARSEVSHYDVTGSISGYATPTTRNGQPWAGPFDPTDPLTIQNMPIEGMRITVAPPSGPFGFSGPAGLFSIPYGGSFPVTLEATVIGQWVTVDNLAGPDVLSNITIPDGQTNADFILNSPISAAATAQLNAFIYVNNARQFFKQRTSWTGLDYPVIAAVYADTSTCNAVTKRNRIDFDAPGPWGTDPNYPCPDMASPPMVYHEYGHWVQTQLGILNNSQGLTSFQEGFSDALAVLAIDDGFIGRGMPAPIARDYSPAAPEKTYPCAGGAHECGQVLAGLWRDIRENLQSLDPGMCLVGGVDKYPDALTMTRQLFVDWAQMTNGGTGDNSAHPLTIREINAVVDGYGCSDAATIKDRICSAGARHGLAEIQPGPTCVLKKVDSSQPVLAFRTPIIRYNTASGVTGVNPISVAVGKVDNDTLNDVVLVCAGSAGAPANVLFYWGTSSSSTNVEFVATPTVVPLVSGATPARIAIADIDGDGRTDVVVSIPNLDGIQVLYQDAAQYRVFSSPGLEPIVAGGVTVRAPAGLVVGQFDSDGRADIAVAGYKLDGSTQRPVLGVLWGESGSPPFTRAVWDVPATPTNADLGTGCALAAWMESSTRFALTMTNPEFVNPTAPRSFLYVFRGETDSNPQRVLLGTAFAGDPANSVSPARFDSDALTDVAITSLSGTPFPRFTRWYRQDSAGALEIDGAVFETRLAQTSSSAGLLTKGATMPLALDSLAEVAVAHIPTDPPSTESVIWILVNTGAAGQDRFRSWSVSSTPNPYISPFSRDVVVADVNDDGFPDLVTANRGASGPNPDPAEGFSVILNRK